MLNVYFQWINAHMGQCMEEIGVSRKVLQEIFSVRTPETSTSFKEIHRDHASSMLNSQITLT